MIITVAQDKLADFRRELPTTGCSLTGRTRRVGLWDGIRVRDVEITLPELWSGSMSNAIYGLPGVLLMSDHLRIGRVPRWRRLVHDFFVWHIQASGAH